MAEKTTTWSDEAMACIAIAETLRDLARSDEELACIAFGEMMQDVGMKWRPTW